jgi:hypothetical protein
MSHRIPKLALVVVLTLVSAAFTSVPAHAAGAKGKVCKTQADVARCAGFKLVDVHGTPPYILALVSARAEQGATADVRKVKLQRVVKGEWKTLRSKTLPYGYTSLQSEFVQIRCRRMKRGVYRVRGYVKWISAGSAHAAWITSRAKTKSELC